MKPMTRRIWIFVKLKLSELWNEIKEAWIIIISGQILYWGLRLIIKSSLVWFIVACVLMVLILVLFPYGVFYTIIKSNWRKADEIERRTRKSK